MNICITCGIELSKKKQNNKFCSTKCFFERNEDIKKCCLFCNKEMNLKYKDRNRVFCSKSCLAKNRIKESKIEKEHMCTYCKKVFFSRRKNIDYCSEMCFESKNNSKKHCKQCNKEIDATLSTIKKLFCSNDCYNANRAANYKLEHINCQHCNNEFVKTKECSKFCSKSCYLTSRKNCTIKHCEVCDKVLELAHQVKTGRFCSRKCSASIRISNKEYECLTCKKHFTNKKKNKKYCSHNCYANRFGSVNKVCEHCNEEMKLHYRFREQKYCSLKCTAEASSIKTSKNVIVSCINCNISFKTIPSLINTNKYCSPNCFYTSKYGVTPQKIYLKCTMCNVDITTSKKRFEKNAHNFCSKKCLWKHKSVCPQFYIKSYESLITPEAREKSKKTIQQKVKDGEWKHFLGKKHTEKTKKKISKIFSDGSRSGENNAMFGRNHTIETKNKQSKIKSDSIINGTFVPYGLNTKKGWYYSHRNNKQFYYRSSWEEEMMILLDYSDSVNEWNYESIKISYMYNNVKCCYIPDFFIENKIGTKYVVEIKPTYYTNTDKVVYKMNAAKKWCDEVGYEFFILNTKPTAELLKDSILSFNNK